MGEAFSRARVPMPFPRNRHALWRRRYLQHDNAAVRMVDYPNASKSHARIRSVVDLPLQAVEAFRIGSVVCPDDLPRLVPDPEHEPSRRIVGEVRLVAQRRNVTAYPVRIEIVARFFELDSLVFPVPNKGVKQRKVALVRFPFRHAFLQAFGGQPLRARRPR